MAQETKEKVFAKLQQFIKSGEYSKLQKKKQKVAEQIKGIKLDDLDFGDSAVAKFFSGYFKGNVRSEGFKRSGDVTHERTLNFNYTTKAIAFVDDDNTADGDELFYAAQLLDMHMYNLGVAKFAHLEQVEDEIYQQDESTLAQIRSVIPLCRMEHEKLGFTLITSSVTIIDSEFFREGEVEISVLPVYANITNEKGKITKLFLGYILEAGEEFVFTINADDLIKKPKSKYKQYKENNSKGKIIKRVVIAALVGVAIFYVIYLFSSI